MGKRMLAGQAARAGVFGALLAAHGYANAPNVFEAEYGGFPAAHTGNRRPPAYDLTMAQRFWTESIQNQAIDLCDNLETLDDTRALMSLLQIEHLPPVDMGGE